jgi:hypothetical protein
MLAAAVEKIACNRPNLAAPMKKLYLAWMGGVYGTVQENKIVNIYMILNTFITDIYVFGWAFKEIPII